jgi:hypothetical protein
MCSARTILARCMPARCVAHVHGMAACLRIDVRHGIHSASERVGALSITSAISRRRIRDSNAWSFHLRRQRMQCAGPLLCSARRLALS